MAQLKPRLERKSGDEIPLSNEALLELMREVLARGAAFRFRSKGWSMSPFIRDGDSITVSPVCGEKLSIGQVAAFIHPESGMLVVHRIIARRAGALLFQGDNSPGQHDGFVSPLNILGVITQVTRRGRPVRFGLGVERYLIAWLSRSGLWRRLFGLLGRALRFLRRSFQR